MFVCQKLNYITPLNLIWYVPINVESLFHCREILYLIAVVLVFNVNINVYVYIWQIWTLFSLSLFTQKKEIFSLNFVKRILYVLLLLFITYVKRLDAVKRVKTNKQFLIDCCLVFSTWLCLCVFFVVSFLSTQIVEVILYLSFFICHLIFHINRRFLNLWMDDAVKSIHFLFDCFFIVFLWLCV